MNTEKIRNSVLWWSVDALVNVFLIFSGAAITLLIFSTAVARYFFKTDIYAVEEIILTLSFWLYFAGGIKGSIEDSHIKADLLDVYLKNLKMKYCLKVTAKAVEFFVNVVLTKWSLSLLILNFHRMPRTVGLKIPIVAAQIPIVVGFLLMAVYSFYYGMFYWSLAFAKEGGK